MLCVIFFEKFHTRKTTIPDSYSTVEEWSFLNEDVTQAVTSETVTQIVTKSVTTCYRGLQTL